MQNNCFNSFHSLVFARFTKPQQNNITDYYREAEMKSVYIVCEARKIWKPFKKSV